MYRFLVFVLFFTSQYLVKAQDSIVVSEYPQVFFLDEDTVIRWVDNNELKQLSSLEDETFREGIIALSNRFNIPLQEAMMYASGQGAVAKDFDQDYPQVERFIALSDIHGQYELFLELLEKHKVIDTNQNWIYGNGHLVINGDIMDRGAGVTEILWLVFKLQQQAEHKGGKLHYLIGNHELMVLDGDLRYINEKYKVAGNLLGYTYDEQFSKQSLFGRWMRERPVMVKVNDILFTHAGISPDFVERGLSRSVVNKLFVDSVFTQNRKEYRKSELLNFLTRSNGPIWYREYFKDEDLSNGDISRILEALGAERIVIGHTSQKQIITLFDGRIICIDSSIKNGENGEVLIYEQGTFYRGKLDGSRELL